MRIVWPQIMAILLVLVLATPSWALISAVEAVDFVESENHFLKRNDRVESPNVLISAANKKYWLVPLISGEDAVTFFPILAADKSLSLNAATNSELFSVARFLRSYLDYRNRTAQQNQRWFVGLDNARILGALPPELETEIAELNVVKAELPVSNAASGILEMQSSLNRLSTMASRLSQLVSVGVDAEAAFLSEPSAQKMTDLRDAFVEAFDELFAFETEAKAYSERVPRLLAVISNSELSVDEKTRLVNLAAAPQSLFTIGSSSLGNWAIVGAEQKSTVRGFVEAARSKSFLDAAQLELEKRVRQNEAYGAIFGSDAEFSRKTQFPSLKVAMDDLQSPANKDLWVEQEQLQIAVQQFNEAVRLFEQESFDASIVSSRRAKRAVELVKAAGFVQAQDASLDVSALITVAVIAIGLLIALLVIKNRNQWFGAAPPENTGGAGFVWPR